MEDLEIEDVNAQIYEDYSIGRDDNSILDTIDLQSLKLLERKGGGEYTTLDQLIQDVAADAHYAVKLSINIDSELQSLPPTVVNTYLDQANELVNLHRVIQENDKILSDISDVFKCFDDELSLLIKDMPDSHQTSIQISNALGNRIVAHEALSKLVNKVVIPPQLIASINSDDINEEYIQNIAVLTQRIEDLDDLMSIKAKFSEDMAYEIDLLKKKACRSVRDFLMKLVISLRRPRTNIQILQHSKLFRYSTLNQFIYNNSPAFAIEIRNLYTETIPIGSKSDVVGYYDQIIKGYFGSTSKQQVDTNKPSAFNLNVSNLPNDMWTSIRSETITEVPEKISQNLLRRSHMLTRATDAPLIIPHVAIKNNKKYTFEQIFRSMNILLLDTVCSEYLFDQQWFAKPLVSNHETSGIVKPIFERIFNIFYENIHQYVSASYDCLGILIAIKLNQVFGEILVERRLDIPCLTSYFYQVDIILWDKFSELFKRNIDSLKTALSKDNGPIDLRPHMVLYGASFFTGAWYGMSRNNELKDKHRNILIHDIKKTVADTKTKSYEEGLAFGKASMLPKSTTETGFTDEFDQILADAVGSDLVRDILA
eukprot:gene2503-2850_t